MTARVINDPSALGWEYDPDTGRWTWGGHSSSGGGGGGSFPEAPVDGEQYARQNAGWQIVEHPEGGTGGGAVTTADVQLTNPTTFMPEGLSTQEDANAYIEGELQKIILDANADGTIYGRQNNAWVAVPTGGGGDGGADLSAYYTKTESDARYQPKGSYLVSSDLNGYATQTWVTGQGYLTSASLNGYATQTWVSSNYQPKGNYLTGFTESDPVFKASPAGTITQAMINNWNSAGGGFDGSYNGPKVTFTTTNTTVSLDLIAPNCAIKMSGSGNTGKYMRLSGDRWEVLTGNYSKSLMSVNDNGNVTATDFIATSDRNKKDHIETAPTGVMGKLRGVTFKWKDSGAESSGVIAQELQDAGLGHLVHEDDDGLSVSYGGLTAYLIEELKLLRKELEELKRDS